MRLINHLSRQEQRIFADRAAGLTYKAIAAKRSITISTVKAHLASIFRKLNITSSLDLQRYQCAQCSLRPNLSLEELQSISAKIKHLLHASDRYLAASRAWPTWPIARQSRFTRKTPHPATSAA